MVKKMYLLVKKLYREVAKSVVPHAIAVLGSALAIANTDLGRVENYVIAVAPTVVVAAANWVRVHVLSRLKA